MPLPAAVAAAGVSALGSIFSGIMGNNAAESNAREQREWQSNENKINRDWQSLESQKARDWEEQMYNLYNSPSAMKKQLSLSGLNPWLSGSDSVGSPMSSSAPMSGSPAVGSGVAAQTVPYPDIGQSITQALGVSANSDDAMARASKTKWETFHYIDEYVGHKAAKKFLDQNPDMVNPDDSYNSPWYKTYLRSKRKDDLEGDILDTRSWLLSRYGDQEHQKALSLMDSQISDIANKMNERDANIALLAEQLNTELAKQFNLRSGGLLNQVQADTASKMQKYLVDKIMHENNILNRLDISDEVTFNSLSDLRQWLESPEGREALRDAEKNGLIRDASWLYSNLRDLISHLPLSAGMTYTKKVP